MLQIFLYLFYLLTASNASLPERIKRFLTPTTYPVPTTFPVPATIDKGSQRATQQMLGSVLANSRPINCPAKRDTSSRRVQLDTNTMRALYFQEAGLWNPQVAAETLQDAEENFIDLLKAQPEKKQDSLLKTRNQLQLNRNLTQNFNTENAAATKNISDIWKRKAITDIVSNFINKYKKKLIAEKNSRPKRTSDGIERTTRFCQERGTLTADGYMHLCNNCAMTTMLPSDRFPRYINEVGCGGGDCRCLSGHGKCQPRILHIKILKKTVSGCRLIIHDGQRLITDNWELYDQPIQVGCECVLDKRSALTSYVVGK